MTRRIRLGVLTPSSNTALEPLPQALIAGLPEVSVHFSRFSVTQIALSADALGQFQRERILDAARLLADAHVDVIGWSGTSAGWLGFDTDQSVDQHFGRAWFQSGAAGIEQRQAVQSYRLRHE